MTTTLERPADSAGALYRRTDISPQTFFQALGRVRRAARDEIERLIEWLDNTIDVDEDSAVDDAPCDGDPDAEPSLGSFDSMSNQIKAWQSHAWSPGGDLEVDRCDDEESDPAEEDDPEERSEPSGIADMDGLSEQLAGTRFALERVE